MDSATNLWIRQRICRFGHGPVDSKTDLWIRRRTYGLEDGPMDSTTAELWILFVDYNANEEYMATGESPSSKNVRNGIPLGLWETTI